MKALLASGNRGKLLELQAILHSHGIELISCADAGIALPAVEETGATYLENARLKAEALAKSSGLPALGDDSGLEVDALEGAPGILSARFSGINATDAGNIKLLLEKMSGQPGRSARFRCVLALAWPDGTVIPAEGILAGSIATSERGTNGFGYDPVFVLPDGRHMAELSAGEKDAISHRAVAAENLASELGRAGIIRPQG